MIAWSEFDDLEQLSATLSRSGATGPTTPPAPRSRRATTRPKKHPTLSPPHWVPSLLAGSGSTSGNTLREVRAGAYPATPHSSIPAPAAGGAWPAAHAFAVNYQSIETRVGSKTGVRVIRASSGSDVTGTFGSNQLSTASSRFAPGSCGDGADADDDARHVQHAEHPDPVRPDGWPRGSLSPWQRPNEVPELGRRTVATGAPSRQTAR